MDRAGSDEASIVAAIIDESVSLHLRARAMDPVPILEAARVIREAFAAGGKLLIFGNGGSAADAQHLATELVGRFLRERPAMPAMALSTDSSVLTSVANDYGYERVFARQIEGLGRPGDVAFAISTSGRSPNVLRGVEAAAARGLTTVALTGGDGGPVAAAAAIRIVVPGSLAPRVQEVHRTLIHVICELVERET